MNENEFELDGKKYHAVNGDDCKGCAAGRFDPPRCHDFAECSGHRRTDGRNVIFVEDVQ